MKNCHHDPAALARRPDAARAATRFRRTQRGNNNAYNQDNPTSWFDWSPVDSNEDMLRFVQRMIAFRKAHPALSRPRFYTRRRSNERGVPDITWHGTTLNRPGFDDPEARVAGLHDRGDSTARRTCTS